MQKQRVKAKISVRKAKISDREAVLRARSFATMNKGRASNNGNS
jgi:hypothetical protein